MLITKPFFGFTVLHQMKEEEKLASQRKVDVTLDTPIPQQSLFGLRRKSNISAKAFLRVTYKKKLP